MKSGYIFILIIFFHLQALSQYKAIDYDFLNQVLGEVSRCNSKFILQEKSYIFKLDSTKFDYYWIDLNRFIDSNTLKNIITNSQKKFWGSMYFVSNNLADSLKIQLISVENASKKPVIKNNTNCKTFYYICSIPVFDDKKEFAVIDFGGGPDKTNMYGCKYLFTKINGRWKAIQTFDIWRN